MLRHACWPLLNFAQGWYSSVILLCTLAINCHICNFNYLQVYEAVLGVCSQRSDRHHRSLELFAILLGYYTHFLPFLQCVIVARTCRSWTVHGRMCLPHQIYREGTGFEVPYPPLCLLLLPLVYWVSCCHLALQLPSPPWLYAPVNSPAQYQSCWQTIELVQPLMWSQLVFSWHVVC